MLNIINDIIDISKIEAGQMKVFISEVDLNKLLEECYRFFKPEAEKKNIELKLFKALQFENVKLKTDSDKLNGILTNLVKNAIKYTKVGSIELGYSLNDLKTEIEFYVKDTGIGIPKDRQAAIFERFIQADIEDKMAQQGAGLGLAIVRAYVEMLKGRIWVESEVNVGSTIYFTLPYKILGMTEIVSPINEEKNKQIKNLKILIVEDDEASNQLLSITVNKFALKIISAINGKEAIKACQNNPDIDLVLMDIQLPEMNGYEATKQIREFNKEVIIIAQTAFAFSGDREKSIAAGCNDYISKPIKKLELEILIQKHINKS
jgi:CheY-like chemotaxis protein